MTHQELKNKYITCELCTKCLNSRKVFGHGNLKARIAVVGEGPGKEEATELIPFIGASGQLLDQILLSVGLKREDLFFTNAVLCRTDDKNRTPTQEEYKNCRTRLFEELEIVNPRYTILTGLTPLKAVMGENYLMKNAHGKWFSNLSKPCFYFYSIYHPSWILHSTTDGEKKQRSQVMWNDIKNFIEDTRGWDERYYGKTTTLA